LGKTHLHTATLISGASEQSDEPGLNFRSPMTLFSHTSSNPVIFYRALDQFCDGHMDSRTWNSWDDRDGLKRNWVAKTTSSEIQHDTISALGHAAILRFTTIVINDSPDL
jgi:hypothetical protein